MRSKLQIVPTILLFFALVLSCVEDLDFNQIDDLKATPSYEASILYLEAPESVINLASGSSVFARNFNFDAFSSDIFASRVLDGVITFIVENTTSKELDIRIEFLNDAGEVTDNEVFIIPATPTDVLTREIAYGPSGRSIDIVKTLSTIRVTALNLGDNTSVSNLPNPLITLKSSGKFRLRLK